MNADARIFVAGHRGLVGSAILRRLRSAGFSNVSTRTRAELDLRDAAAVLRFFEDVRPEYVFLAAARVGGILANATYPGDFVRDNLQIQMAVLESARLTGVHRLLFLGSSCAYPKHATQPLVEASLLTGPLEPTNAPYAIAKIAGIQTCWAYNRQYGTDFRCVMPTNLYGPNDDFDLERGHVLPAMIRRFHEAKVAGHHVVKLWGTGSPRREFLHVDDAADALLVVMNAVEVPPLINIGVGRDLTIGELAESVRAVVGYEGEIHFDASRPDGTPRKLLDTSRMTHLGWVPGIDLPHGLRTTYRWFLEHVNEHDARRTPAVREKE